MNRLERAVNIEDLRRLARSRFERALMLCGVARAADIGRELLAP